MRKLALRLSALALVVVAGGTLVSSIDAMGGPDNCPDIYEPVICSNGQVYSNACYARLAKAHHCVPYGDS